MTSSVIANGVVILLGMELIGRGLLDELLGERQLSVLDRHIRNRHICRAPKLGRIVQLLHNQNAIHRTHQDEVLLASGRVLPKRRPARLLERLAQQSVGALAAFVWAQEIGFLEVKAVHFGERDELVDVDGIGGLFVERLQLLGREDDELSLGELVALGHLVPFDDLAVLGTDVLLLEAGSILLVHHVEADTGGRLARGIQTYRDRDESERDCGRSH